ncbi:MAG: hypothetical protein R3E61_10715 [Pseudomonadales bacterium]
MPDGAAVAIPNAALALPAMPPSVWEALLPEPLVVARQTEVDTAQLLERARQLVVTGDWQGIEAVLAEGPHARLPSILGSSKCWSASPVAKAMDERRFAKESLYSSKKMRNRLAAKQENLNSLCEEAIAPSFLRRKSSQGKAQFEA